MRVYYPIGEHSTIQNVFVNKIIDLNIKTEKNDLYFLIISKKTIFKTVEVF